MCLLVETQFLAFSNASMEMVNVPASGSKTRPDRGVNDSIMHPRCQILFSNILNDLKQVVYVSLFVGQKTFDVKEFSFNDGRLTSASLEWKWGSLYSGCKPGSLVSTGN